MPKEISAPDGSVLEFPDDMPDDQIESVLQKEYPAAAPTTATAQAPITIPEGVSEAMMYRPEEMSQPPPTALQQGISRFARGFTGAIAGIPEAAAVIAAPPARFMERMLPLEEGRIRRPEENLLYRAGQEIRGLGEQFPVSETRPQTFLGDVLPSAAGSMAAFMLGGAAGRALKVPALLGVGAMGAGAGGADAYREALAAGASDETAFNVFLGNAALGTTEAVPIGGWLNRLNKASGGRLKRAIIEGSEEAAQEIFQQFGSNLIAGETYDPKRKITEGVAPGGGAGFTLGTLASLVVSAIGGRRARAAVPPQAQPPPPIIPSVPSTETINLPRIEETGGPLATYEKGETIHGDVRPQAIAEQGVQPVPTRQGGPQAPAPRGQKEVAQATGFTYDPAMEQMVPGAWHFTDRRADSPTAGLSVAVPKGSDVAAVQSAIDAKVQQGYTAPSAETDIISKLESLKLKPGDSARLYAFPDPRAIQTIGIQVWNDAISTAQAAVRAGVSIAEAVTAAVDYIKSKVKTFDEAAIRSNLEHALATGERVTAEIPPAPGEKTTPSQGTWFAGNNPKETSGMMQERANAFLEGKTDEQAITDLNAIAAGDTRLPLDNQAANFAIKDLLVRITKKAQTSTNPVEANTAWEQVDRLSELSRRMGAEDARSLVSRQLAYKQIDWLMPVLAWRGVVQEKWRKTLGLQPNEPVQGRDTEELSKKLKLPRINGPEAKRLAELSERAKGEPQGVRRNKTLEEMVRIMQSQTGISKLDLLRDFWYASVLMRVGTMVNVIVGSLSTGASFAGLAALERFARLHPIQAKRILGQFLGGTIEGALIAGQIAHKGAYHLLPDAEQRMLNLLTGKAGARFDNLEHLLRQKSIYKKAIGAFAFTRRFMAALDYIGALGTRDAMVLYGALSRNDRESLAAVEKRYDTAENQRATEQARTEMGPDASRAEILVRKREILEEGVSDDITEAAVQTARRAAQNAEPRGLPGFVYRMTAKLPFWAKAPLGLAFMRSAMNMVQNAADYMPGVGAVSATRGELSARLPENHPLKRFGMDIPIEERRMMWTAQAVSLGIAAAAAALFLDDDEDKEGWEISGSWRGLTPKQKSQLMEQGERPNSIRVGKKGPWINFKQMPFAPPLSIIGSMRDEQRFHAKEWNEQSAGSKIFGAWLSGLLYVRDISSLSGIAGMFDQNAWSTQESPTKLAEKANKLAAQTAGRAATGLIPSISKEIDEFIDPTLHRPSGEEMLGWWTRNIPFARKTVGYGPALNNFGEPIQLTRPPLKSWVGFGKDNDLYQTLGALASRGVFLPEPGKTAKIVDDNVVFREMTEEEWYKFVKTRGPIFKDGFTPGRLQWLRDVDNDQAIKWLGEHSEKSSEQARNQLWPLSRVTRFRKPAFAPP